MMKKVGLGLLALVVVLVGVVAMQPASFHVERSATMKAPPDVAFALVNDFHQWRAWSPWDDLDPSMKRTYEGPAAGAGASYSWEGNDKVGQGRMTIEDARAPESVKLKLEFLKPFAATNVTTFSFKPVGDSVAVTWAMDGNNGFLSKAFGLVMSMDKLVGGDFD